MEFRTTINIPSCSEKIGYKTPVLMLGSCFSDNIGKIMKDDRFSVLANPLGILYNPFSVSLLLKRCLNTELLKSDEVFEDNGVFKSFLFHSSFAAQSHEFMKERADQSIITTGNFLKISRFLILTLGTARYYSKNGCIVANCHKQPRNAFVETLATPKECADEIENIIWEIRKVNPDIFIIFTISPVRHLKDGVPGAQQDKAVLFCALEKLLQIPSTFYFPAYEIMTDELRDYRFYADDMAHPSKQATEYIYQKFGEVFFTEETKNLSARIRRILLSISHRPMFPESPSYKEFITKTKKEIEDFAREHPYINIVCP